MKTTMQKSFRRFLAGSFILTSIATTALIPSCKFHIIDNNDDTGAKPGTVTVSISQSGTSSSSRAAARTVVPSVTTNAARYDIICTNSQGTTVASTTITSDASYSFSNITPGSITVTVNAYNASSVLIATGSATFTLAEGSTASVPVLIKPSVTGTLKGNIALKIRWPTASASEIRWSLDGGTATVLTSASTPAITSDGTKSSVTLSATGLTSGVHTIGINFTTGGLSSGSQLEVVNVYDNMTSDSWVNADGSLSAEREYTATEVKDQGNSSSTGLTIRILSGSTLETLSLASGTTSVSTSNIFSSSAVSVIPSANVEGQSISCSWDGTTYTTVASNAVLTHTMATALNVSANPSNILYLRATAPNTGTITDYTLTIRSPIHVTTSAGLSAALSDMNNLVLLDGPIDLLGAAWSPVGSSTTPFSGTFDGNGNTIKNFTIDASAGNAGFFAYTGTDSTIKNLHIENITMTGSSSQVGAIAGNNNGKIYRCSSSGTINGGTSVGGLVGSNIGTVEECWSNATVTASLYSGGLVGSNGTNGAGGATGLIKNCYARGVTTVNWGGGLVGSNNANGTVVNSYAAGLVRLNGTVSGGTFLQGLIGNSGGSQTNSYFDLSKITTSYNGGTSITSGYFGTAESMITMRTQSSYSGWDFGSVWTFTADKNGGYPCLRNVTPTTDTTITATSIAATSLKSLIESNLNGDYILSNDITLSGSMEPIGSASMPFTGVFDGGGHAIINAVVTGRNEACNGFFACLTGTIFNLNMRNVQVTQSYSRDATGGLVGYGTGTIWRCSTTGTVSGSNLVGGLVGNSHCTVSECYSTAAVTASTGAAGGLIGQSVGPLTNCYARGTVTGPSSCGGLVGYQSVNIYNSYAAGTVSVSDSAYGGIRGNAWSGSIYNCFYDASLTSGGNQAAQGTATATASMKNLATFTGSGWDTAVWGRDDSLNNGYPYLLHVPVTNVTITGGTYTSANFNALFVDFAGMYTLAGPVTITGTAAPIGSANEPFVGTFDGAGNTINGLTITGSTETYQGLFAVVGTAGIVKNVRLIGVGVSSTGTDNTFHTGALAGTNQGLISNCHVDLGSIVGAYHTGGLVGVNSGVIEYSSSKATVFGNGDATNIGGLAGTNFRTIRYSYATGSVEGNDCVGGFVGLSKGGAVDINNCYARGAVTLLGTATGDKQTGGFVGLNTTSAVISNCFAAGSITLNIATSYSGGFAGNLASATITNCYYDTTTSSQSDSGKGIGKTTSQLTSSLTLGALVFDTGVWQEDQDGNLNNGYPDLIANSQPTP